MNSMIYNMYCSVSTGLKRFLYDEKGEVNIVAIVVLIGIAVLLAIVFRKQIEDLLKTLFRQISGNATNALNGSDSVGG